MKSNGPPGYRDAFPFSWPTTAQRLHDLVDGPVLPGHGDVVDREFVAAQTAQLGEVATLVRALVAGDIDEEEAVPRSPIHPRAFHQAVARAHCEFPLQPTA